MKKPENIKKPKIRIILMIIMSIIPLSFTQSQTNTSSGYMLSISEKESAVNSISKLLFDNYIFPEVSVEMEKYIKSRFADSYYDNISDPQKFAEELTNDLQSISRDKHIRVQYNPELIKKMKENPNGNDDEDAVSPEYIQQMKMENYYFRKVEKLSGNIGYIDFRQFGSGEVIKDKVASVMGFVEDCDAIIFDMRYNGGGDPTGIQVITSYLFGEEPVHLNDLYYRPKDTTEQYWTLKDIEGKRMPDVPVFVLTSSFTFSGAEEFSYNLKNLKRATIVGEITGGGAHPGGMNIIDDNFAMFVPIGRAINPITKTNWEGTGVAPDVEINSLDALTKAHILALEKLNKNNGWLIESLNATLNDIELSNDLLKSYAGNYGDRNVIYSNGKLYYQRSGRPKYEMTPMSEDIFMLKEIDFFRIKFVKDASGNVVEFEGMFEDGRTDSSPKTKN